MKYFCLFALALLHSQTSTAQDAPGKPDTVSSNARLQFLELSSRYLPAAKPVSLQYKSQSATFGHLNRPWQTRPSMQFGRVAMGQQMVLQETTERGTSKAVSVTVYANNLFFQSQDDKPVESTTEDRDLFLRTSCRYTPALLLRHVGLQLSKKTKPGITLKTDGDHVSFSGSLGDESFEIQFSPDDNRLQKIVWDRHHATWGDQKIEVVYTGEKTLNGFTYPVAVKETSFDTTTFETQILAADFAEPPSVKIPPDYKLTATTSKEEKVVVEKFSDNVTFLELVHTQSRTTLVEFKDFLMVIDAPISSHNGQLIVDKIKSMKLGKPIKYFAFGHHHPHYLGGVRPFIAEGATVLTTKKIAAYVKQLAGHQHSRTPDVLQKKKQELQVQSFTDKEP